MLPAGAPGLAGPPPGSLVSGPHGTGPGGLGLPAIPAAPAGYSLPPPAGLSPPVLPVSPHVMPPVTTPGPLPAVPAGPAGYSLMPPVTTTGALPAVPVAPAGYSLQPPAGLSPPVLPVSAHVMPAVTTPGSVSVLPTADLPTGYSPQLPVGAPTLANVLQTPPKDVRDAITQEDPMIDSESLCSDTSGTIIYSYAEGEAMEADGDGKFQLVKGKRRRRASKGSLSTADDNTRVNVPRHGLTVILKPKDPAKIITRFNPLSLKASFELVAPDGVLQLRPNYRLNLLAVDTRNVDATARLLKITTIMGIPVEAYEPRPDNCAAGVIRGVPVEISDAEIRENLLQRTPVKTARRLGKTSQAILIVFNTDTKPQHVILGYTRYTVYDYTEKPKQCSRCQRFGHIAGTCNRKVRCARCGGDHDRADCKAEELRCPNCRQTHEAAYASCPTLRQEKNIYRYKNLNKVDYKAAKAAVVPSKSSTHHGTKKALEKKQNQTPKVATVDDFSDFPSLPSQLPDTSGAAITSSASSSDPASPASTPPRMAWRGPRRAQASQQQQLPTHTSSSSWQVLLDAVRSFLAPFTSPVVRAIITLLDVVAPLIQHWH
ncbi:uncharacterized protein LOC144148510 [Haemaphysalis longicornis]